MRAFSAQIIDSEGQSIADKLTAWIEFLPGQSASKPWRGSFYTYNASQSLKETTYRLRLSDGRSGLIGITYVSYADGMRGSFQGIGALSRARENAFAE